MKRPKLTLHASPPDDLRGQLVTQLRSTYAEEKRCALATGDLAIEIEAEYGSLILKRLVADAGLSWGTVYSRMRVSRLFSPGHWARDAVECPLLFGHLRHVAHRYDRDDWLRKAITNRWTPTQLLHEIQLSEVPDSFELWKTGRGTYRCACCDSFTGPETIKLHLPNMGSQLRLCSETCAISLLKRARKAAA